MFTARGFGHLINNTVRGQAAKQLRERGRLPRHQGPRAHTDAPVIPLALRSSYEGTPGAHGRP